VNSAVITVIVPGSTHVIEPCAAVATSANVPSDSERAVVVVASTTSVGAKATSTFPSARPRMSTTRPRN
jgi:hypothetical protein